MNTMRKLLCQASETIANVAGYIRVFQANKTRITNKELNHILEQCQQATAKIGEALIQMPQDEQEDYKVLVTEGDLRAMLAAIERRRSLHDKPYCLQLHIQITPDRKLVMKNTIEELRGDMIAEMFEKGDLDFL